MHEFHEKEFTLDDFSYEHLFTEDDSPSYYESPVKVISNLCNCLNYYRVRYLKHGDKKDWWQIIQLLPSSYNQRATVQMNYQVLRNMYHARKNHKLDEWHDFCNWIEKLPYSELIIGGKENEDNT